MTNFFAHLFVLKDKMRFFYFTRIVSHMGKTPAPKKPALGWPAQIFLIIPIGILFLYHITQLNVVSVIRVSD